MEIPSPYLKRSGENRKRKNETEQQSGAPKAAPNNILLKLAGREIHGGSGNPRAGVGSETYFSRSLYQNIRPNFSVTDIMQPDAFLRTFTPDGKLLIGFDIKYDSSLVSIFNFRGPQAANNLFSSLRKPQPNWIKNEAITYYDRDDASELIRDDIFDTFFVLNHEVKAAPDGFDLERECSVITSDSRYLIVACRKFHEDAPEEPSPAQDDRTDVEMEQREQMEPDSEDSDAETEALGNPELITRDYCVSVIDLKEGEVVSRKMFNDDRIIFTHNQAIYLYNRVLTLFSYKNQTIHVFEVSDKGVLQELRSIGRFTDQAEEELFNCVPEFRAVPIKRERFLTSLAQKIMQYIHEEEDEEEEAFTRKPKFYKSHEVLQHFEISKIQLLDEVTILMKYSSRDCEYTPEPNNDEYHFFVIFDMKMSKIVKIEDTHSKQFAEIVSTHSELIRNTYLTESGRFMTNAGNSMSCRKIVDGLKEILPNFHSLVLSHHVTAYCQSFTPNPYLDHNLFTYDTSKVNLTGRPRVYAGPRVNWLGNSSSAFNFHLTLTDAYDLNPFSPLFYGEGSLFKLVFHPNSPFMISLQRFGRRYYVNIHFRLDQSILRQD